MFVFSAPLQSTKFKSTMPVISPSGEAGKGGE